MTAPPEGHGSKARLRVWLPPVLAALLFAVTLWILHRELQAIGYRDVREALHALPTGHLLLALLFTVANYLILTSYDQLAFIYVGKEIARWRIAMVSFVSYAVSNSVGFALLSGTSVRHRFYSRWGLGTGDLSRIVVFNATIYWLGLLTLGGWSLIFYPHAYLRGGFAQESAKILGSALMATVAGYLVLCVVRKAPLRLRGFNLRVPPLPLALGQLLVSVADWAVAATVLYVLLPAGGPPYGVLLGAFLAAQLLGLVSHVPGGLAVFEGTLMVLLGSYLPVDRFLAALLLYRLVYYVGPLTLALLVLLADEIRNRRVQLARVGKTLGAYSVQLAPRVLALFTFMAGLLLLFSGATPVEHERLYWMARLLPVGLFEASHFLGSIVGVGLLVLAQAVVRRLQVAYYLVLAGLLAGIITSLLKAALWEEAILLALLLLVFVPSRGFFDRQAALFDTRFSPGWVVAIIAALGASVWLGIFAFRHVEYSNDLWWKVALNQDAPRFLRATVGAAVALLGFGIWRLLRPLRHVTEPLSEEDLAAARRVIDAQPETLPFLVYLRDKALLFNADRSGFVMYGVHGRTWAALGDPVGPAETAPGLIRVFVERADDFGGLPVFYQVRPAHLHRYADLGMTFAKLGEEARVSLDEFSLKGSRYGELRSVLNRMDKENVSFRVIEAGAVAAVLPQLKAVSDDWLAHKSVSEKGFSLGFFDPDYLARLPVIVLEHEGKVVAFANLLSGPSGEVLSVDLVRFVATAPRAAMDGLLTHLFVWGRARGYHWFNLGMAPLSGLVLSPVAPVWARFGRFVYRHGEAFYNFEGLRAYKEKFHPIWEPRYLAYPGGLALPVVLADIAALSAGGYVRIFR